MKKRSLVLVISIFSIVVLSAILSIKLFFPVPTVLLAKQETFNSEGINREEFISGKICVTGEGAAHPSTTVPAVKKKQAILDARLDTKVQMCDRISGFVVNHYQTSDYGHFSQMRVESKANCRTSERFIGYTSGRPKIDRNGLATLTGCMPLANLSRVLKGVVSRDRQLPKEIAKKQKLQFERFEEKIGAVEAQLKSYRTKPGDGEKNRQERKGLAVKVKRMEATIATLKTENKNIKKELADNAGITTSQVRRIDTAQRRLVNRIDMLGLAVDNIDRQLDETREKSDRVAAVQSIEPIYSGIVVNACNGNLVPDPDMQLFAEDGKGDHTTYSILYADGLNYLQATDSSIYGNARFVKSVEDARRHKLIAIETEHGTLSKPLIVSAKSVTGNRIVLSRRDAVKIRKTARLQSILQAGRVVIVTKQCTQG